MKNENTEEVPYFCPSCEFESQNHTLMLRHRLWFHNFGFIQKEKTVDKRKKIMEEKLVSRRGENEVEIQENTLVEWFVPVTSGIINIEQIDKEGKEEISAEQKILGKCEYSGNEQVKEDSVNEEKNGDEFEMEQETEEDRFDRELIEQEEKKGTVTCSLCPKVYKTVNAKTSLGTHMKSIHLAVRHMCDICGIKYRSTAGLKRHIDRVHNLNNINNFSTSKTLSEHIKTDHIGNRLGCENCDKSFTSRASLMLHVRRQHLRKQVFCHICNFVSKSKPAQNSHFRNCHSEYLLPFPEIIRECKICGESCMSKGSLEHHIMSKHNNKKRKSKSYRCIECNKLLRRQYTLCSEHSCRECKTKLRSHFTTCTEHLKQTKQLTCKICGFLTKRSDRLRKHTVSSNCDPNKAKKNFKCGKCHLYFTTIKYMIKHEKEHELGKPFKCEKCDIGFTQSYAKQLHLKSGVCKRDNKTR